MCISVVCVLFMTVNVVRRDNPLTFRLYTDYKSVYRLDLDPVTQEELSSGDG